MAVPAWIERHGRRTPFAGDAVSAAIFAATESLGAPNAFLARELADGALHFLAADDWPDPANGERVGETIEKVVRELGHPALARAFMEVWRRPSDPEPTPAPTADAVPWSATPVEFARWAREAYSLRAIYRADVAAAHREGLIAIGALDAPDRLWCVVLDPPSDATSGWRLGRDAARRAAEHWVVDGAEAFFRRRSGPELRDAILGLSEAAEAAGAWVWAHLGTQPLPPWAPAVDVGPLFAPEPTSSADAVDAWREAAARPDARVRLVEHGAAPPAGRERVRDVALGFGMDRRRPAAIVEVGVRLDAILERPDVRPDTWLGKLPSLARMAASAGEQRRRFLRRVAPELSRGFLLDRAVVRIVPLGLDVCVRRLLGTGVGDTRLSADLARRVLTALSAPLAAEQRTTGLNLVLADPPDAER